jgi:hypothetical protein
MFIYAETFLLKGLAGGVKLHVWDYERNVRKEIRERREPSATSPTHLLSKSFSQCPSGVREPTVHSQFRPRSVSISY